MSLLNKFFWTGAKKEVITAASHTNVAIAHETPGNGFDVVPNAVELSQLRQGPLPYAINYNAPSIKEDTSSNKVYDEIPFQFSPACSRIWSADTAIKRQPKLLKEIDWDSLCYDFTLEKSILQS